MELSRFIKVLKQYKNQISKHQLKTIRGQAINGDLEGAQKGLEKLTGGRNEHFRINR